MSTAPPRCMMDRRTSRRRHAERVQRLRDFGQHHRQPVLQVDQQGSRLSDPGLFGHAGVRQVGSLTFGWRANAPAMNDAKCIVANVWNSDASGNWKVSLWQNGTKVCDMTRVKTYDYWAYAYHVLYYSKSVGTTWGKNLDHYYYGNLASGTPETAGFRNRGGGRHGQHLPHLEAPDRLHRLLTLPLPKSDAAPRKGRGIFLAGSQARLQARRLPGAGSSSRLAGPPSPPLYGGVPSRRSIPAFGLREVVISAHSRLRDGP